MPLSGTAANGLWAVVEAMADGAQDGNFFLTNKHGGLLGNLTPLNFHGAGVRERCPWPCQRTALSRTVTDGS